MRNSVDVFMEKVQDYLRAAFSERVQVIREAEPEMYLEDIVSWQSGFTDAINGLASYPGCIVLVNKRTLTNVYYSFFKLVIGIGLTADDPSYLEQIGRIWEDILEDTIRADWHLGGACLDVESNIQIDSDCTGSVYVIQAILDCTVDVGGYVYEPRKSI